MSDTEPVVAFVARSSTNEWDEIHSVRPRSLGLIALISVLYTATFCGHWTS